ncbi:MAG: SCO family protein [Candidatus Rokuibacteriota bacterium]
MGRTRRAPVLLLLALAAVAVAAWAAVTGRTAALLGRAPAEDSGTLEALGQYGDVPDFSLIERQGHPVRRTDLLGTVWVANFIYTRCTETCPLQTAQLARLQTDFPQPEFRLVSITVDPEHDTPAALARYAEQYGADPVRWLFLTGDKGAIYRLATDGFRLGVVDPDDPPARTSGLGRLLSPKPAWAMHGSKGLVMHSPRLVLVDRRATIRAYHRPDDPQSLDRLRENLRTLLER